MQLRIARHTNRLDEIVGFYRDGLGLPEVGRFDDHHGYDGVFLAVPGTDAHLEFTTGGEDTSPTPHPETLVVLYLGSGEAVAETCERVGAEPVESANPYWRRHGVTLSDPDGFHVVLVPHRWPDQQDSARVLVLWGDGAERDLHRLASALTDDQPQTRAVLVGAQVVGIALARYAVLVEPLAS